MHRCGLDEKKSNDVRNQEPVTFEHFLLAVSHNVDVLDAEELKFNV